MSRPNPESEQARCPNCAEWILVSAVLCRFCDSGLADSHFHPCPFCAEMIRREAMVCRYCKTRLFAASEADFQAQQPQFQQQLPAQFHQQFQAQFQVQPQFQQQVQPQFQQPVPQFEQPAQPQFEQPAQPQFEQQVQAQFQQPAPPQFQQQAQPQFEQPIQPQFQAQFQQQVQPQLQPQLQPQQQQVQPMPVAVRTAEPQQRYHNQLDDKAMDSIFAKMGLKERPTGGIRETVEHFRAAKADLEATSRLSAGQATNPDAENGTIDGLSKFLFDTQDLAAIERLILGEANAPGFRKTSQEHSLALYALLRRIDMQPHVLGSIIVGQDGLLIASTLPQDQDPEMIGVLSLGIFINTTNMSKKFGHNHVQQLVCMSSTGYIIVANFGAGILITLTNCFDSGLLIQLMRLITELTSH